MKQRLAKFANCIPLWMQLSFFILIISTVTIFTLIFRNFTSIRNLTISNQYSLSQELLDLESENLDRLYQRAAGEIDRVTHMRARAFCNGYDEDSATDFQKGVRDAVKLTTCQLIDNLQAQESSGMGIGIQSVSNDGYSESYKITNAQEKEAQLYSTISNGLRGTGLAGAICL